MYMGMQACMTPDHYTYLRNFPSKHVQVQTDVFAHGQHTASLHRTTSSFKTQKRHQQMPQIPTHVVIRSFFLNKTYPEIGLSFSQSMHASSPCCSNVWTAQSPVCLWGRMPLARPRPGIHTEGGGCDERLTEGRWV